MLRTGQKIGFPILLHVPYLINLSDKRELSIQFSAGKLLSHTRWLARGSASSLSFLDYVDMVLFFCCTSEYLWNVCYITYSTRYGLCIGNCPLITVKRHALIDCQQCFVRDVDNFRFETFAHILKFSFTIDTIILEWFHWIISNSGVINVVCFCQ